jgi:hypothetical protein
MHDGIAFERRGVPALVILSEPFANTGRMMARTHKLPDLKFALIPHPVGMRAEQLESNAESVYAQMLTILKDA